MNTKEKKMRESFEAWATVNDFNLETVQLGFKAAYTSNDTVHAWIGYKAAYKDCLAEFQSIGKVKRCKDENYCVGIYNLPLNTKLFARKESE